MTTIRANREAKRLRQFELARLANLHGSVLSKLETGTDKAGPTVRLRVSRALGVPESELFDAAGWPVEVTGGSAD